ncbi:hypothetical protein VKT23_019253 [Stygiomarasmius scandens]|uniref:Uncharacterized protein n=1 Tax=Marasmiellus scandens TaxID=2682957 RepID=A0ABR1IM01_9AGAR
MQLPRLPFLDLSPAAILSSPTPALTSLTLPPIVDASNYKCGAPYPDRSFSSLNRYFSPCAAASSSLLDSGTATSLAFVTGETDGGSHLYDYEPPTTYGLTRPSPLWSNYPTSSGQGPTSKDLVLTLSISLLLVEKMYGPAAGRHVHSFVRLLAPMVHQVLAYSECGSGCAFLSMLYVDRVVPPHTTLSSILGDFEKSLTSIQVAMLLIRVYVLCLRLTLRSEDEQWKLEMVWLNLTYMDIQLLEQASKQIEIILDHNVVVSNSEWISFLEKRLLGVRSDPGSPLTLNASIESFSPPHSRIPAAKFREIVFQKLLEARSVQTASQAWSFLEKPNPPPLYQDLKSLLSYLTRQLPDAKADAWAFVHIYRGAQENDVGNQDWLCQRLPAFEIPDERLGLVDNFATLPPWPEVASEYQHEDTDSVSSYGYEPDDSASESSASQPRCRMGTPVPVGFWNRIFSEEDEEEEEEEGDQGEEIGYSRDEDHYPQMAEEQEREDERHYDDCVQTGRRDERTTRDSFHQDRSSLRNAILFEDFF